MHALVKHRLVDADVEKAAFWYWERDANTALRFVDEASRAMFAAAEHPLYHSVRFEDIRRVRLRRFPHSAFYVIREETVLILAVLHGARDVETLIAERKSAG